MGNRGGRFHRDDSSLGARRWASKRWIACVCEFRGRRREVWGAGYTELFFLDEVTALSAGHRPCFECRRPDALAFARAFVAGAPAPSADAMDAILHGQRLARQGATLGAAALARLPDGAMVADRDGAYAMRGPLALPWHFEGYGPPVARAALRDAQALTPPAILGALGAGYVPRWSASAG